MMHSSPRRMSALDSDDLLTALESDNDLKSLDTNQLLDMLEQEVVSNSYSDTTATSNKSTRLIRSASSTTRQPSFTNPFRSYSDRPIDSDAGNRPSVSFSATPRKSHNGLSDTFSLGSLGSLAISASTRSRSSLGSRSSRSSRSTRSSETTNVKSALERRQRKELKPVKARKRSTRVNADARKMSSMAQADMPYMDMGIDGQPIRYDNLHTHHPVVYPKRSGHSKNDQEDVTLSRDSCSWTNRSIDASIRGSEDENGLFRRVDRVKSIFQRTRKDSLSDEATSDEGSFLTGFLKNHTKDNNVTKKRKSASAASMGSTISTLGQVSNSSPSKVNARNIGHEEETLGQNAIIRFLEQCYEDGGSLFPKTRMEFVKYGLLALLVAPLFHVAITVLNGDGHNVTNRQRISSSYLSNISQSPHDQIQKRSSLAWAGSTQVMLSASSSLQENLILIPNTDWIDLQMARTNQEMHRKPFYRSTRSHGSGPSSPQRLALPSLLDPLHDTENAAMVLFSISASNSVKAPLRKVGDTSNDNAVANTHLWNVIQKELKPQPLDAWPSWIHNSLSNVRDDGFTVMYPMSMRNEAKLAVILLAEQFGQFFLYEFVTWKESALERGSSDSVGRWSFGAKKKQSVGSVHSRGKDGSVIDFPLLPGGQTDLMIRTTIPTDLEETFSKGHPHNMGEPVVVMRRVKELPVEDELTLRDFEGPSLEDLVWL